MERQYIFTLEHMKRQMNFPFRLRAFGYLPNNFHPPHKYKKTTLLIGLLLRGSCIRHEENGNSHQNEAPLLSISKTGSASWTEYGKPWDEIYFSYTPDHEEIFRNAGLDIDIPYRKFIISERFEKLKEELIGFCHMPYRPGNVDRMDMTAYQLIMEAVLPEKDESLLHIQNQTIHEIASWLQNHFMNKTDLESILKRHGISRRTFYREWGKVFPVPVHQFIIEQRLALAKELLRSTTRNVYEIAEECGFSNAMDLCRTFRKHLGLAPLAYRRQFNNTDKLLF